MKPKYTFVRYRVSRRFSIPGILAIAVAMALAVKPARAASGSWNVDAGGSWGTAGNWNPAAVPGSAIGDTITFNNNISAARAITLDGARTMGDLNIGDPTTGFFGFTLNAGTGGTLTMDVASGSATIDFLNSGSNAAANTIGAGITLNDPIVIRSNSTLQQTLGGVITDGTSSRSVTFNNDVDGTSNAPGSLVGQFSLSVANTYDGGTSISDVRVVTGIAAGFGTGTVTVTGAGQAYLSAGTHTNAFTLNGTGWVESGANYGSLRVDTGTVSGNVTMQQATRLGNPSGTGTISGILSGLQNVTKVGAGTLVLSGANTYTGITTVNDGLLRFGSTGAIGNSQTVIVENPANPGSSDTNALHLTGNITLGAGRTVILRNNSTSNIPNARATFENNSGNNTWLGAIVLDGGTNQALLSAAGTFTVAGNVSQTATPSTQLFIRGGGNGVLTGNLNIGSATLFKTDTGTWTFSSSGHVHGPLGIGNGTLVANTTNAFNPASAFTLGEANGNTTKLTINGGFTQAFTAISTHASTSGAQTIDGAGALDVGAGGNVVTVNNGAAANDLTITANIIGSGGITKAGAGNLVLNNTTSGPVTVSAGTLTSSATLGGLSLASGTTLVPGTTTTAGTITTPTLALTGGTLAVNLGSGGSDVINVTGSGGLTQSGTTTITVTPNGGFNPLSTFYPVISYNGASPGTSGFTVGTLPGRLIGSVTDQSSAIGITATNDRIIWNGSNGNWDVNTTSNWKKLSDSAATNFLSQDDVIFNNDGIAQNSIALAGTINPVRVEFAQTGVNTYILASGTLSGEGVMPFIHSGTGTTILRNANTYTGPTTITAGTLEVDHSTGTLSGTSEVTVDAGASLKLTRNNGDFTFNRNISGSGTVMVDPNTSGTAGSRGVTLSGNNSGFSGTWDLDPSGTYLTNGTFRAIFSSASHLGSGSVIARNGGQLWVNGAVTVANGLTLTGAGFQEGGGGTPTTAATGADGSSPVVPALAYGGIGAARLENNAVLSGNITLNGTSKVTAYNATASISGNITNSGSGDDFVVGGGGAGSNLFLTGDNSGLERIWVNGGGTAGTHQLLIGNSTTTGTLGSGDVILYQDAAAATLRFQRSNGYTLASGQKILAAHNGTATNLSKAWVIVNTTGTGLTLNGGTIDLSDGTNAGALYVGGFGGGNGVNGSVLNIDSGSTVQAEKLHAGDQSGVSGTVNMSGGTVSIINQVRFGHYSNNTSVFNMSGGSLTITATPGAEPSAGTEINGLLYLGVDGTGVLNHSGGTINTGAVVLDNRGITGGADQYNLSASGTLELRNSYGLVGRNTDASISLGGGTIRNVGSGVDVSINATNISSSGTTTLDTTGATNKFSLMGSIGGSGTLTTTGGGLIELEPDSNTTKTSVSTGTGIQTISANLAGSSAFTKLGTGTTTLGGTNTYNGATTVTAGRLNLTGSIANSALTVANGASLGGEGTAASITLGTNPADVTDLFVDGSTSGALVSTGAFTVNGPVNNAVKVNLTGVPATSGDITVVQYGSAPGLVATNFELIDSGKYRSGTFTVNPTNVTLAFDNKNLTWDGTTATWETGGTENDWNDATNDNFFTGDKVTFDDTYVTGNQTVTMTAGLVPGSITVNNTDYKYTLSGGGIDGATGIVKTGDFDLDLGGTNTFTGAVSISDGIVKITTTSALGSTAGGTTVSGSGTLDIGGGFAADALNIQGEPITISGDGVGGAGAIINSGATQQPNAFGLVTLAGNASIGGTSRYDIRGASSVLNLASNKLTKIGGNVVYGTVDGTITSGDIDVNAGTFGIWNGTVQGTGTLKANSGGVLELSNMVAGKFTRNVTLNGGTLSCASATTTNSNITYTAASTISNTADFNLTGALGETGGPFDLVKTGSGTLILTGTNGLTGKVSVTEGILRVPTDTLLGPATGADAITLQSGGRIMAGNETIGVDFTLPATKGVTLPSGDGGFHVWAGFTMNYAGAITGAGNLTKTDAGTLNFTGTASHTGATVFSAGTTNLNAATVAANSGFRVTGGTTNLNAGTTVTTSGSAEIHSATLNITGGSLSSNRLLPSNAGSAVAVINQSGGTVTVTGTDSTNTNTASFLFGHFSGATASATWNMSGGTLNSTGAELSFGWDNPTVLFNQSGGTVKLLGLDLNNGRNNLAVYNLTGGRLNIGANGITTNAGKAVNLGGGTLGAFADWTTTQAMALTANGGNVTVDTLDSVDNSTGRTISLNGVLSGPGGLIKNGAGTLALGATNTFVGNTTVNAGTLSLNGGGGANGTLFGSVTMNSGTLLRLNAGDVTGYDAATRLGVINLIGAEMNVAVTNNQTLGNGVINMTGAAITGVASSNLDFFQTTSAINTLASATTSTISGVQLSIRQNAGVTVTVASGTTPSGVDLEVSSVIASNGGFAAAPLIKAGNGTMKLTAANLHTGGTNVNAGKLLVNNTTGSGTGTNTVTVAGPATLGGTGTLAGATTVSGTLAPGNSVGTLNFGSTLGLNVGSTYAVEITGAGTNDKVVATGALTANGTIAVTLDGYVPVAGNTFDIADAPGISGSPTFNFAAAPLTAGLAWDTSQFLTTGTIAVISADPYTAWATANGITEGKFGDDDDDGVLNLLEFATNSDAGDGSAGARVYPKMHSLSGDNVLTLTAAVRKLAVFGPVATRQEATKDKIKYMVEATNDLGTWTVPVTELNPADSTAVQGAFNPALPLLDADWEWHTFRTDGGVSIDSTDFIRLKVEEVP